MQSYCFLLNQASYVINFFSFFNFFNFPYLRKSIN